MNSLFPSPCRYCAVMACEIEMDFQSCRVQLRYDLHSENCFLSPRMVLQRFLPR